MRSTLIWENPVYIGKTFGYGSDAPAPAPPRTPTGPSGSSVPVAPSAPRRGEPVTPGAAGTPRGPVVLAPARVASSLWGTIASLRGTPTPGRGPSR
jgi:hypothetical protein